MTWISTLLSDKALRWSFGLFLIARVSLTIWSLLVAFLLPIQVQNLDLFKAPILATFELATSERHTFSREVDGNVLLFRSGEPGFVVDTLTSSVWALKDGRASAGPLVGNALNASAYTADEVFPYRGVAVDSNPLLALWQRFDVNWYLAIAARGYSLDDGSTVYFPMYPALIHLAGGSLLAALLISNIALVGALYMLYRLAEAMADAATARRATVYLLLFPSGFFLFAAYTESLFLFFTLGAFLFAIRHRWYLAAFFGVCAALTRLQGVLLLVPLVFMLSQEMGGLVHTDPARLAQFVVRGIALLLIPLATAVFLVFTNLSLVAGYVGQLHAQFVLPWENVAASVALLGSGQASLIDALNLLTTVIFGVLLIAAWRKLPREYALYALLMFFAPLFRMTTSQPLVSMLRYVLALFPVFIVLGGWGRNAWVNRAFVYSSVPLQLFLSAQFLMWGWVG